MKNIGNGYDKTMTMTITMKLESLSSLGDLFVGNIVSLICFHSL